MSIGFDLSDVDDVRLNAEAILRRLRNGSMPCDGAWPPEQIERFSQ